MIVIGSSNPETGYVRMALPATGLWWRCVARGAAISIMPWEFWLHMEIQIFFAIVRRAMKGYIRYIAHGRMRKDYVLTG